MRFRACTCSSLYLSASCYYNSCCCCCCKVMSTWRQPLCAEAIWLHPKSWYLLSREKFKILGFVALSICTILGMYRIGIFTIRLDPDGGRIVESAIWPDPDCFFSFTCTFAGSVVHIVLPARAWCTIHRRIARTTEAVLAASSPSPGPPVRLWLSLLYSGAVVRRMIRVNVQSAPDSGGREWGSVV